MFENILVIVNLILVWSLIFFVVYRIFGAKKEVEPTGKMEVQLRAAAKRAATRKTGAAAKSSTKRTTKK